METIRIDNILARRSIRRYTAEPVQPEQVETLLKAAMAAPSAGNRKPWHFIVVTDPATRQALAAAHPHAQMVVESPVVIVPCGEPALSLPGREEYWIQDLAAATENILVTAPSLGLGTVWCGVFPIAERVAAVRRILGVPDHVIPFALIAVGHPAEHKEPRTQYDPARVHMEHW